MALNGGTHIGCYCCQSMNSQKMDLDSALDELGMLSSVTDSRKQYLQERMRTRSESALITMRQIHPKTHSLPTSSSSNYHILQIDTKYVTGFSDTQLSTSTASAERLLSSDPRNPNPVPINSNSVTAAVPDDVFLDHSKDYRNPPDNLDASITSNRRMRLLRCKREDITARNRRIVSRKRAKQPYEVPWRLTQSFQDSLLTRQTDIPECKSNSSSPVKPVSSESALTRSRSLDNIDFSSFFISESHSRRDIDHVASGIKNLTFSDS